MKDELHTLRSLLEPHGQTHLLRFWERLAPDERQELANQIRAIDFRQLAALVAEQDQAVDYDELASRAESPPAARVDGTGAPWTPDAAIRAGEEALRAGQVGMILVAGGQGTRLGFDHPKGLFPIGPVSNRTLFEFHADRLKAMARRYGVTIPLYIMTSPATDAETRDYFESNHWLGWSQNDLRLFCQGTMPAVEKKTGRILLESPGRIALSPDGHGGLVAALGRHGCLDDMARRNIEHVYYAQIDNPLAPVCDPFLIGQHRLAGSDMTTQVVRKRFPLERVGNVVSIDGRVCIIEYSDLPEAAAHRTHSDGSFVLWAGNIAIHVFRTEFLRHSVENPNRLPFHRAAKKVAHVDEQGRVVEPNEPNAIKFERFIFDLLPEANNAFVVEGLTEEVFAPVKNADGAETDTPKLAREAISRQHRAWLTSAGVQVPDEAPVEIHPDWALDAAEVKARVQEGLYFNGNHRKR